MCKKLADVSAKENNPPRKKRKGNIKSNITAVIKKASE
jgi:hypothetical protein